MSRERLTSITMMGIGIALLVGGVLWLWMAKQPVDVEGMREPANPTVGMGSIFIGLIVGAVGVSIYE